MKTLFVPDVCLPLLREQRTHYKNHTEEYAAELSQTYEGIKPYLPEGGRILDIGCGMAGIDVFLARHYADYQLTLLDKQGVSKRINAGFNAVENFAHYHDFDAALALLSANDVHAYQCIDVNKEPLPADRYDLAISLLSWGFHYPINAYTPNAKVIIADVRKGTDGEKELAKHGKVTVVHEAQKYRRVVVQC